jgi:CheY-like chemotaxis protein
MKLVLSFSFLFVLSVVILFSIDPTTSLVADSIYMLDFRAISAPEDKASKNKDYSNINKSITKRILVVDDNPDITFTFKKAFEEANRINGGNNRISFHVNTYNDPIHALSEFKRDFYDLILVDINMPKMNGFDFCGEVLKVDANPKVCFMSSGLINREALREQYPSLSIGCFMQKPITIGNLISRVNAELD